MSSKKTRRFTEKKGKKKKITLDDSFRIAKQNRLSKKK